MRGGRGILGLIIDGKRHAYYNNSNSHPAGLGKDIAKFIISLAPEEWDEMTRLIKDVTWVDRSDEPSDKLQKRYAALGYNDHSVARGLPAIPSMIRSDLTTDNWRNLLQGIPGARILYAIKRGDLKHVLESYSYGGYPELWDWNYFVDFEKRLMETWNRELIATIDFEDLKVLGAEKYVERIMKIVEAEREEEKEVEYESEQVERKEDIKTAVEDNDASQVENK